MHGIFRTESSLITADTVQKPSALHKLPDSSSIRMQVALGTPTPTTRPVSTVCGRESADIEAVRIDISGGHYTPGKQKKQHLTTTMAVNPLGNSVLDFSMALYKQLVSQNGHEGNVFYSPFSISAALSMALAGARANTAKELSTVLRADAAKIHSHYHDFFSKLASYADDVKLHVANRMYSEQTFPVLESYLSLLRDSYGATIESVDFKNDCESVRQQINAWVEKVTESKIKDLLPVGGVDDCTSLILVNAIYFKGFWKSPFDAYATHRSDFHLDSKNKKEIDMMYKKKAYKMCTNDELGVAVVEIPYQGDKTSMVVLLPNDIEGLSKLEDNLTAPKLVDLMKNLRSGVDVELWRAGTGDLPQDDLASFGDQGLLHFRS
ncbi:hypothetical protein V5799_026325 [Amblyomma americanum]|uniref:Serpin domain-containing protein n=1 Tax=Amblyomma americanum TaxID=6943 RepID=A0AAQ4DIX5_AMBAM